VFNSTNSSTVGNFKLSSNDFARIFCCSTAVRTGLHNASVSLSRNIASSVTRERDEVSDVTSVNTVLQQCTSKVVRLHIKFEITSSTTVVEFTTTMALVVLMERFNFVSAGTETVDSTEATGLHFMDNLSRGSALILLKQASWLGS
jgi:hypothetical protein